MTVTTARETFEALNSKKQRGRPEAFDDLQQQTFVGLVGAGMSRRQAAIYLGFSPSTISKRIQRDPGLADLLRQSEVELEFDLLHRMLRQTQHSWRATAWLLERIHPERYAKGRGKTPVQPSLDEIFHHVSAIIGEQITDAAVRQRIESRLSELAAAEFEEITVPLPKPCDFESPQEFERQAAAKARMKPITVTALLDRSVNLFEQTREEDEAGRELQQRRTRERRRRRREREQADPPPCAIPPKRSGADRIDKLLSGSATPHESRRLDRIGR